MPSRTVGVMKVALAVSLIGLGASVPAQADQLDKIKERGKVVIGVKNDYPPFGSLDANGTLKGFEIDLAKSVAKQLLGSETALELVPVVASNRIEFLNNGRIDVIFATLGMSADRAKVIDFTEPYYMMEGILLLAAKDTPIKSWEDLKGHKVCGVQGSIYNRTVTEKYGAETVLFTGTAEMFKAFQDHRCEGIAYDGPILQQKIGEPGWAEKYKIALPTFDYIPIAGGLRKNEPAFRAAIDKAIAKAETDGVLLNAEKAYGMGDNDYVTKHAAGVRPAAR